MTVSALMFGVSMFIGPAAIIVMVRNGSPQGAWGAGIAAFTTAFGIGQAAGPMFSGWLGDVTGSLLLPIASSTAILADASAIAYLQQDVRWVEPARANTPPGQPTMAAPTSEKAA